MNLDESYGATTARFYDSAYTAAPAVAGSLDFYRECAREGGGPVLELGCGTGRVLLELAGAGFPCTGLDASARMLAVLRAKADPFPNLRLVHAPMQRFEIPGERFGLIFSAFRAVQHLYTVQDQLECLACVRAHLAPNGLFAFDVFAPILERMAAGESPEREQLRFEQDGETVVRYETVSRDPVAQLLHVRFRYERRRGDEVLGNEYAEFDMRWFLRFELEHLLARAGFRHVSIYGDFDRREVGADTPAYIVVARA